MGEPRYLTLADNLELMRPNAHGRIVLALEKSQRDEIVSALRLAAKPADEGLLRRCADIALAIDSGRGNEKEIAKAILALSTLAPNPDPPDNSLTDPSTMGGERE